MTVHKLAGHLKQHWPAIREQLLLKLIRAFLRAGVMDEWTRRRLRMFLWKQWKRGSVRFAELTERGVDRKLAAQTAGSAHGPWRLAESPGLHLALSTAYFASLGIPSLFGAS